MSWWLTHFTAAKRLAGKLRKLGVKVRCMRVRSSEPGHGQHRFSPG